MDVPPCNGKDFEHRLLTQLQPDGGDGDGGDVARSGEFAKKGCDINDGMATCEVDENDEEERTSSEFNRGFDLLTQSNEPGASKINDSGSGSKSSDTSSCDNCESSGTEEEWSSCDSFSDESNPLEVRRNRNIERRNNAFLKGFHSGFDVISGGQQEKTPTCRLQHLNDKATVQQKNPQTSTAMAKDQGNHSQQKRRGMLFPTIDKSPKVSSDEITGSMTHSIIRDLKSRYPQRSREIHTLCSQLVSIVKRSEFSRFITNNARAMSSGNTHYSEAYYQGGIRIAAPPPIMITGSGGSGKTCIVRDAVEDLRRKTNGGGESNTGASIASAFVDCASLECGSVAAAMNDAFLKLWQDYNPTLDRSYARGSSNKEQQKRIEAAGPDDHNRQYDISRDLENYPEEEEPDSEEVVEQKRKQKRRKKTPRDINPTEDRKAQSYSGTGSNGNRAGLRNTNAAKAGNMSTPDQAKVLKGSLQSVARNTESLVALFGRTTYALIQENPAEKLISQNCRCAFVILDNAERILSWKKYGLISPLTQIFLLPSVLGVNLTLILISRSSILEHSSVRTPPESLLDIASPLKIHFHSYTSAEMIKLIMHASSIKDSITGLPSKVRRTDAITLKSKLKDFMYTSMLNTFVPSLKSSSQDITEIIRLARLFWPEYTAPLVRGNECGDKSLKTSVWNSLERLWNDSEFSNGELCDADCPFSHALALDSDKNANGMDVNILKKEISENLDKISRESMRNLLTNVLMPGRALQNQNIEPYVKRIPYMTKFLLLAAFLCKSKSSQQDLNLFTKRNTGKSKKKKWNNSDEASAVPIRQQQPFPLERLLSVFRSIIDQYGQNLIMGTNSNQLGTGNLFGIISQLIEMRLLNSFGSFSCDSIDITRQKFSCPISREDASIIASSVGFPLDKYQP